MTSRSIMYTLVLVVLSALPARAQQTFWRTLVVDQTGNWDHTTIQDAIDSDRIGNNPDERWTILIFSGTYVESVSLHDRKENVDLVGIDPEAVIIAPSSGNAGITITSGAELSRNNSIRNLTIKTTNAHGINIVKPPEMQIPKKISIEGVTIEVTQTGPEPAHGIAGAAAEHVRLLNCRVRSSGSHAVIGGSRWTIRNVNAASTGPMSTGVGLLLVTAQATLLEGCQLSSTHKEGLYLRDDCQDITVRACEIRGGESAVRIMLGQQILLDGCRLVVDNSATDYHHPVALFFDRLSGGPGPATGTLVAEDCQIEAYNTRDTEGKSYETVGVQSDTDALPRVVNCQIRAEAKCGAAYGVYGGGGSGLNPSVSVIGGVITTGCEDSRETEVYDVYHHDPEAPTWTGSLLVSGTRMSKWHGPIGSAERPRPVVQRTLNVTVPSATAILPATLLTESEQEITSGLANPDVYRVLSVTGNLSGMNQEVYLIGTDWAGNAITDRIRLNGNSTVVGRKPFKTVTKIILPAKTSDENQTVSVGTSARLGLQSPIASAGAVLQQARKTSGASSYTIEALDPADIDVAHATVQILDPPITTGDSFEWALLGSD